MTEFERAAPQHPSVTHAGALLSRISEELHQDCMPHRVVNALPESHWAFRPTELARCEAGYGSGVVELLLNRH